ncbi:class I tRNA ligase family protein, partial [Patescibacteria group bacterium]|nr:class I tRNA ligase family protein [Patescibacteria group bacterium]
DPWEITKKYGADALRWYFYTVNQPGDPKLFSEKDLQSVLKKFIMTFWNSHLFFQTYLTKKFDYHDRSEDILDKWILSRLNNLILEVTKGLERYDITGVARKIENFVIEDLSLWYIRRSRKRFQKPASGRELNEASATLGFVLLNLSKLTAPFCPFLSEKIYQDLTKKESVHLEDWPKAHEKIINKKLEDEMTERRGIISEALAERAKLGIKVRQPLRAVTLRKPKSFEMIDITDTSSIVAGEINVPVEKISFSPKVEKPEYDTKITSELREEGQVREIIRQIQDLRKKAGLTPKDKILIYYSDSPKLIKILAKNKASILRETKAKDLKQGLPEKEVFAAKKRIKIDNEELQLAIKKVEK